MSDSSINRYFDYNFNIISYSGYLRCMNDIDEFRDKKWSAKVHLDVNYVSIGEMFIACQKSNLQKK